MERITRVRAGILLGIFALVLSLFALKLYDLQVIDTGGTVDNAKTFTIRTTVRAARGEILDRNGHVLVTNRASYDLVFNHFVICSAPGRNAILRELVLLCREMDIDYVDHLPVSADAPFTSTLESLSAAYQGYFQTYLEEKPELDSDISAPTLMKELRKYYRIPEDWPDADARAVIGLRYELDLRQGVTNLPIYTFLKDASTAELSAILELSVPGLKAEASVERVYNTVYAAHILGYMGAMDKEQWEYYKTLTYEHTAADGTVTQRKLYSMDALIGQTGLEAAFESYLHGVDGIREDVVAVDGTVISSTYIVEPIAGKNVELSIDLNIQSTAENSLAELITGLRANEGADGSDAEGGAVVVMNVKTGEILACASYPTYNLSTFREDYNTLLETPFDPLYNRALQATYPPGSTYKMSMVIAAIDSGTIGKDDTIHDKGKYTAYEGFAPECLQYTNHGYGHGNMNAMTALEKSCNYYFYYLADRMKIETMDKTASLLGLGELTGVELSEKNGWRANPTTRAEKYTGDAARWYPADQIMASIGQSDNSFTPVQLCSYTATLANRGTRYKATFLSRVLSADYTGILVENQPEILSKLHISDEAYEAYTEGMRLVAQTGTARKFFAKYPIAVAAKTGTAEHGGGQDDSDHGAFVCYAPYDDPEIAVVVYVEKGGHGSTVAEIGKNILDAYFYDVIHGDTTVGENQIG